MLKVCHPKDSHKKLQASPYKGSCDVLALGLGLLGAGGLMVSAHGMRSFPTKSSLHHTSHLTLRSHSLNVAS